MSYNYTKEKNMWDEWKKKEENELMRLGFPEYKIKNLRDYDERIFKSERNYRHFEYVTDEKYFVKQTVNDKKNLISLEDVLDELENQALYEIISRIEPTTYKIIDLKLQGYSVNEISDKLGIEFYKIYRKIRKIKEVLKKV